MPACRLQALACCWPSPARMPTLQPRGVPLRCSAALRAAPGDSSAPSGARLLFSDSDRQVGPGSPPTLTTRVQPRALVSVPKRVAAECRGQCSPGVGRQLLQPPHSLFLPGIFGAGGRRPATLPVGRIRASPHSVYHAHVPLTPRGLTKPWGVVLLAGHLRVWRQAVAGDGAQPAQRGGELQVAGRHKPGENDRHRAGGCLVDGCIGCSCVHQASGRWTTAACGEDAGVRQVCDSSIE